MQEEMKGANCARSTRIREKTALREALCGEVSGLGKELIQLLAMS
jgi:hypothetical protein